MGVDFTVSVTPDLTALFAALEEDVRAAIKAGLHALAREIEAHATEEAPVRTSNLVNSISSYLAPGGMQAVVRAAAPYAGYVHEGTGLFGPHQREIVIKRTSRKGDAYEVHRKGHKPNPFFTRAVGGVDAGAIFEQGVQDSVRMVRDDRLIHLARLRQDGGELLDLVGQLNHRRPDLLHQA